MAPPLVIAPGTRLAIEYATHRLRDTLEPFIVAVSNRLKQTGILRDSLHAAADAFPEIARYFVIDRESERSFTLRDEYLFRQWTIQELLLCRPDGTRYNIELAHRGDELVALHDLLALCSSGTCDRQ